MQAENPQDAVGMVEGEVESPPTPIKTGYLTTREVATQLGITVNKVNFFIRKKRLEAVKFNHAHYIDEADFFAFKEQKRTVGYPKGRPRGKKQSVSVVEEKAVEVGS